MTTREELIRQRNEIDAKLAKLDATPWEERLEGDAPVRPIQLVKGPNTLTCHLESAGDKRLHAGELSHVVHLVNAGPQLIACVLALRRMREHINKRQEAFVSNICDPSLFAAATKALEELDAL